MVHVAINGLGRIGRAFLKMAVKNPAVEVVAVNDLGDVENLAYLLKYDTAYGVSNLDIRTEDKYLIIEGQRIHVLSERDPKNLPWSAMNIDVVVESTGVFTKYADAAMHLQAGASKVVISAPGKGDPVDGISSATILMGVNDEKLGTCQISSNGSCTTNASSPIISILDEAIGIEKAMLNTVHGYTSTQSIVDGPNKKDFRKGRAGAQNIIPTSTGAATAVTKAYTSLENKFDGIALRVPVIVGSVADITFIAKKDTTVKEINQALRNAAQSDKWKNIFAVSEDPIVSSDIVGRTHASIADLPMTRVVDGNLVKVLAWYDNETGYTNALLQHVIKTGESA